MNLNRFNLVLVSVAWLSASWCASAASYSFADDFSDKKDTTAGSQDRWQYFQSVVTTNRTGVYPHLDVYASSLGSLGYPAWRRRGAGVVYPHVGKNTSDHIIYGVMPGEGLLVPARDGTGVAIGFKSPAAGYYQVQGSVRAADNRDGTGVNWYLDRGSGAANLAFGTLGMGENNNFSFPAVYLNQGEFLYLVVDPNGNIASDFIAVDFKVSEAPAAVSMIWQPTLRVNGIPGRRYAIESIDQVGGADSWKVLTTYTEDGQGKLILDPTWVGAHQRFYRMVELGPE
ncbi:MAG: hypothetical protein JNK85_23095 [Verrucomicrobiales bacterium]|nr:hypothetical protein [Verrucomicrobiales bacterium]